MSGFNNSNHDESHVYVVVAKKSCSYLCSESCQNQRSINDVDFFGYEFTFWLPILVCIAMVAYYLIVPSKNILNLCKRTLRNIETYCWMNMTISDKGFTICVRAEIFPENSRAFYCLTFLLQKRTNTLESFWNCILFLQQQNYKHRRVILKCQHLVIFSLGKVPYNIQLFSKLF